MQLTRTHYGIAASLAALMVAAPIGWHLAERKRPEPQPIIGLQNMFSGGSGRDEKKVIDQVGARLTDGRSRQRRDAGAAGSRENEARTVAANQPVPARPPAVLKSADKERRAKEAFGDISKSQSTAARPAPGTIVGGGRHMRMAQGKSEQKTRQAPAGSLLSQQGMASRSSSASKVARSERSQFGQQIVGGKPSSVTAEARQRLASRIIAKPDANVRVMPQEANRDRFANFENNPTKQVAVEPVSTFSIDVDTAAYAFVRRALNSGRLPPRDAVRVEELINYFTYDYPLPASKSEPFRPTITVTPTPWDTATRLMHIAVKGYELKSAERPPVNLVLLADISGSMRGQDRLPLLKTAFRMLINELREDDTIGIVTYASGSGVALEPTKVAEKHKILAALDRLGAGGSTAGAQGIRDAYRLAEANFSEEAVNRVILGTDGDFNVGITDRGELKRYIEKKRKTGIFLSILGFGQGNYNDALMQTLAQNGNGTAAYIDTLNEARKVLVEEASSTLFPIAKDVKIQVEFNPAVVSEYRLIGYETRALKREDFNNDKVDAGDVGSGHAVTAIYEITPKGAKRQSVDPLRYAAGAQEETRPVAPAGNTNELGFFKLRYKLPAEAKSQLITQPVPAATLDGELDGAPRDVRFAIAVAAFGQKLRGETGLDDMSWDVIVSLANAAKGADPFGLRAEFVNLVRLAKVAKQ